MDGKRTSIADPNGKDDKKNFTFDYSYWSHDGCKEEADGYVSPDPSHPNGRKFADQVRPSFPSRESSFLRREVGRSERHGTDLGARDAVALAGWDPIWTVSESDDFSRTEIRDATILGETPSLRPSDFARTLLQRVTDGLRSLQKRVFDDLGAGMLKNAWDGYNSTLFAYGQTGSGKSWSVIGYGPNKGIVPLFTEQLFQGVEAKKKTGDKIQFEVKFNMLEIYNEVVRDLLDASKNQKKGLKIRENPKKGFYAEGLKTVMVASYDDIKAKMDEGTLNRTVAATNMNATSSRAHTIVGITFTQKFKNAKNEETAKSSIVNLVDLAGSERVESTGATGSRLKEGASINLSLTCLGNCIHALAESSNGKKKKVPFRDSSLTKLLQNALGGNSKTVMIAAISPADINFDESLSTLRYADRAKQIKTTATINEDPTEKLLRELKEENEKLKAMLASGNMDLSGMGLSGTVVDKDALRKEWEEEMKARMMTNEKEMEEMRKTYEEKLKQMQGEQGASPAAAMKEIEKERKTTPHIYNLNFDPQLTGRVVHILKPGVQDVGNRRGKESSFVMLGPGIQESHALIVWDQKKNAVSVKPVNGDCRVLVNGTAILGETPLAHNDRLVFGTTQIWVYQNPKEANADKKKYPQITYDFAQEEIAAKAGIDMSAADSNTDMALLHEDLLEVLPAVEEANSISAELDKRAKFEIVIASPQMLGKEKGKTEVCVKMKNLENGMEYVWPKEKFLNRLYIMKEMYSNFEDEDEWELPVERDPFREDPNTEVRIGTVNIFLQPIAYMVELKEQLDIIDLKGKVGVMNVEVVPCNAKGKEYVEADDMFVDTPEELVGKELHFKVKILDCRGLPNKYKDIYCKYKDYMGDSEIKTKQAGDTANPDFNHEKFFSYKPVTKLLVDFLKNKSLVVDVMGKHRLRRSAMPRRADGVTTKDMLAADRDVFSKTSSLMNGFKIDERIVDPQKQSIIVELLLMKKTQARLQLKVDALKKMLELAERQGQGKIPTNFVRDIMKYPERAEELLSQLQDVDFSDEHYFKEGKNERSSSPSSTSSNSSSTCTLI
ncbi:unnamed protein product [Darwinula stevensoni]|uniref:Kinesin motor domain-containing protein n=1 Tax=Darwinula stevensoni TaxID=69355 RepID=A0A7R9A0H1_9CRUS|nr:unnamed protein product [Darwinula stevensoni]CAG0885568.1 unnamed protein product [Darwinula stevensoni]